MISRGRLLLLLRMGEDQFVDEAGDRWFTDEYGDKGGGTNYMWDYL